MLSIFVFYLIVVCVFLDVTIRGIHGELGVLQSADVTFNSPVFKALIAPDFILINRKLYDWKKSYTNDKV